MKTSKEQEVQEATWWEGPTQGSLHSRACWPCHSASCCPRSGEACDHPGLQGAFCGGKQVSRGHSTDCRGCYGGPGCSQSPAPGTSLTLEQTQPVSGQGAGEAAWALTQPLIMDRWSGGPFKLCCTCSQPSSAAFMLPLCPGLVTSCPGLVGHGPGSQPCQSLSLLTLAPRPLQGAGSITWGTAWKPLGGGDSYCQTPAHLTKTPFPHLKMRSSK